MMNSYNMILDATSVVYPIHQILSGHIVVVADTVEFLHR